MAKEKKPNKQPDKLPNRPPKDLYKLKLRALQGKARKDGNLTVEKTLADMGYIKGHNLNRDVAADAICDQVCKIYELEADLMLTAERSEVIIPQYKIRELISKSPKILQYKHFRKIVYLKTVY